MAKSWGRVVAVVALAAGLVVSVSAADPGIQLIGWGEVSGHTLDLSGLAGQEICRKDDPGDCIDQATFGGWGSGFAYTGHDNVYLAVPDRGPFDGRTDVQYRDRFHVVHMVIDPTKPFPSATPNITVTLLDTRFLKNEYGVNFVGDSSAFANNARESLRFDPEGARVGRGGSIYISDEYGPYLFEFNRQGHLVRRFDIPDRYLIDNPTGEVYPDGTSFELDPSQNTSGRQANRGMENLAITPDGETLVGMMQNALIQDNGLNSSSPPGRRGLTCRIFTFNLKTGERHEYVYLIDATGNGRGVNAMVALNDHEFLVLERDNRSNRPTPPNAVENPNNKRIYRINLQTPGLTDVSDVDVLGANLAELTAAGVVPVSKTQFINLLDSSYERAPGVTVRSVIAEKMEAMAWGPDLPDGRHVLYVVSDNDLYPDLPTQVYAFAVNAAQAGVTYEPQRFSGPLFPPGQLKKILR